MVVQNETGPPSPPNTTQLIDRISWNKQKQSYIQSKSFKQLVLMFNE